MELWELYHGDMPAFFPPLLRSDEMQRLRSVGMNCGCEYTRFPLFRDLGPYSRFDHSVGVGLIVWHFTGDPAASAAGLFHDIATPVFAHVVDFLRGDYLTQEATESGTRQRIEGSEAICAVLRSLGLTPTDVCDYHLYPIADNDTPRLSADRLEYTLGNLVNFGFRDRAAVGEYYRDLTVGVNEDGAPELMFCTPEIALAFARDALRCSYVYVAKEDRYAMQMLSELLGAAIRDGVLRESDLDTTEPEVIARLTESEEYRKRWNVFCSYSSMEVRSRPGPEEGWRQIFAKKRCIDPLLRGEGRASRVFPDFGEELSAFLEQSFSPWLRGIAGP